MHVNPIIVGQTLCIPAAKNICSRMLSFCLPLTSCTPTINDARWKCKLWRES